MTSEQESIMEALADQKTAMASVEEQADIYNTYLLCTQEYFEKTTALEKLDGWLNRQNELFGKEEYGDDLGSVNNLLSVFSDTYTSAVASKKEVSAASSYLFYVKDRCASLTHHKLCL